METALVKKVCPVCWKTVDEFIIIPTRLNSKSLDSKIKNIDGKIIGFSEKPCKNCQKQFDKGFVGIVIVDLEKSKLNDKGDLIPEEIYRIVPVFFIKREILIKDLLKYEYENMIHIDEKVANKIGLMDAYEKFSKEQNDKS